VAPYHWSADRFLAQSNGSLGSGQEAAGGKQKAG
jgi:hypothetical protein